MYKDFLFTVHLFISIEAKCILFACKDLSLLKSKSLHVQEIYVFNKAYRRVLWIRKYVGIFFHYLQHFSWHFQPIPPQNVERSKTTWHLLQLYLWGSESTLPSELSSFSSEEIPILPINSSLWWSSIIAMSCIEDGSNEMSYSTQKEAYAIVLCNVFIKPLKKQLTCFVASYIFLSDVKL